MKTYQAEVILDIEAENYDDANDIVVDILSSEPVIKEYSIEAIQEFIDG